MTLPVFQDDLWEESVARDVSYTTDGGVHVTVDYYRHNPAFTAEEKRFQYEQAFKLAKLDVEQGASQSIQELTDEHYFSWLDAVRSRVPPWLGAPEIVEVATHRMTHDAARESLAAHAQHSENWIARALPPEKALVAGQQEATRQSLARMVAGLEGGGFHQEIPVAHLGDESAVFGLYTAKIVPEEDCDVEDIIAHEASISNADVHCKAGPINVLFHNFGHWTNAYNWMTFGTGDWEHTSVGADRSAFLKDERHQGADRWHDHPDEQVQLSEVWWGCMDRTHARLWGSLTGDYHWGQPGYFRDYSVAQAHEEVRVSGSFCGHHVTSHDNGRDAVVDTFSGNYWTGAITYHDYGSTGRDFDGLVVWIELVARYV